MKGIDVYNGTGTVDFTAVKNAGYEFVMIKSSEGHTLADKSLSAILQKRQKPDYIPECIIGSGAAL